MLTLSEVLPLPSLAGRVALGALLCEQRRPRVGGGRDDSIRHPGATRGGHRTDALPDALRRTLAGHREVAMLPGSGTAGSAPRRLAGLCDPVAARLVADELRPRPRAVEILRDLVRRRGRLGAMSLRRRGSVQAARAQPQDPVVMLRQAVAPARRV